MTNRIFIQKMTIPLGEEERLVLNDYVLSLLPVHVHRQNHTILPHLVVTMAIVSMLRKVSEAFHRPPFLLILMNFQENARRANHQRPKQHHLFLNRLREN
jgi:hypothetical protein